MVVASELVACEVIGPARELVAPQNSAPEPATMRRCVLTPGSVIRGACFAAHRAGRSSDGGVGDRAYDPVLTLARDGQ